MIEFNCDLCGARIVGPQNRAGQTGKCPKCGELNRVPAGTVAATPAMETRPAEPQTELGQAAAATRDADLGRLAVRIAVAARKRPQGIILVAGLLFVGLVCLFPPTVSLDGPNTGQSAGRRFLFAREFSRKQIDDAAFRSWRQSKEGLTLDAQRSQAQKESDQAETAFTKANAAAIAAVGSGETAFDKADAANHAAADAARTAMDNVRRADDALLSAMNAAVDKAVEQAIASRWPFSGIIRARDYGRAFLECMGIAVLTAMGFLYVRYRQRRHQRASIGNARQESLE